MTKVDKDKEESVFRGNEVMMMLEQMSDGIAVIAEEQKALRIELTGKIDDDRQSGSGKIKQLVGKHGLEYGQGLQDHQPAVHAGQHPGQLQLGDGVEKEDLVGAEPPRLLHQARLARPVANQHDPHVVGQQSCRLDQHVQSVGNAVRAGKDGEELSFQAMLPAEGVITLAAEQIQIRPDGNDINLVGGRSAIFHHALLHALRKGNDAARTAVDEALQEFSGLDDERIFQNPCRDSRFRPDVTNLEHERPSLENGDDESRNGHRDGRGGGEYHVWPLAAHSLDSGPEGKGQKGHDAAGEPHVRRIGHVDNMGSDAVDVHDLASPTSGKVEIGLPVAPADHVHPMTMIDQITGEFIGPRPGLSAAGAEVLVDVDDPQGAASPNEPPATPRQCLHIVIGGIAMDQRIELEIGLAQVFDHVGDAILDRIAAFPAEHILDQVAVDLVVAPVCLHAFLEDDLRLRQLFLDQLGDFPERFVVAFISTMEGLAVASKMRSVQDRDDGGGNVMGMNQRTVLRAIAIQGQLPFSQGFVGEKVGDKVQSRTV